jgi:murein L,D-transpeptidase YcbB/YkuD
VPLQLAGGGVRIANAALRLFAACAVGLLVSATAGGAEREVAEQLRTSIEELLFTGELSVDGATISAPSLLPEFYTRRDFAPAWTPAAAAEWLDWLATIDAEGLRPDDYYLPSLTRTGSFGRGGADRDILLTASLLRAADDLRFGKVDPASLDGGWNLPRDSDGWDTALVAEAAIASGTPGVFLATMLPRPRLYLELQAALRRYRDIAAAGAWPSVAAGRPLRLGDGGPRVATLRQRLAITGDHAAQAGDRRGPAMPRAALFDAGLEQAVRTFQERHGLDPDGVVGPATLAALNVPAQARIDQIRLNLERGRWVFGNLAPRFIVVNTASFQVFLVEHDVPIWQARAVVGRYYRQTPTFRGELEYLVLNPTWTIPPTILREDIVPLAKKDPGYLARMGIDVLARDGRAVDPRRLDWSRLGPRNFPYVLEQRAGPENLLGRVKFVFPNPFFVFLHDTPQKSLFGVAQRTFSSGCIRVEDALELAELVLDDPSWTRARFEAEVATGRTQPVHLREPLPVLVLYWTASVDALGRVRFLPDIYERDRRVLAALDAPAS